MGCGKSSPADTAAVVLVPNTLVTVPPKDERSDTVQRQEICDKLIQEKGLILRQIKRMKEKVTASLAEDNMVEAEMWMDDSAKLETRLKQLDSNINTLQGDSIYLGQNNRVDFTVQRSPSSIARQMRTLRMSDLESGVAKEGNSIYLI